MADGHHSKFQENKILPLSTQRQFSDFTLHHNLSLTRIFKVSSGPQTNLETYIWKACLVVTEHGRLALTRLTWIILPILAPDFHGFKTTAPQLHSYSLQHPFCWSVPLHQRGKSSPPKNKDDNETLGKKPPTVGSLYPVLVSYCYIRLMIHYSGLLTWTHWKLKNLH